MTTAPATVRMSLNSDMGEGYGVYSVADDQTLLSLVSDVNVACGFHAGDPSIMRRTCETAAERGLAVGAHFGFHDLRGFGRRRVDQPSAELRDDIVYQIGALRAVAEAAGTRVHYVKAHGALHHCALEREDYAEAMLDAIQEAAPDALMLCQSGVSLARRAADRGITLLREGFIDRTFLDDGLLTPRSRPDALISNPVVAAERAVRIATTATVESVNGVVIPMEVDSLCIHSDSPGAVAMAQHVRAALEAAGVIIAPLA